MTKLDEILKGSYARYIAHDFVGISLSLNKRIPLLIDDINLSNIKQVQQQLMDCFGDIEVSVTHGKAEKQLVDCSSDIKVSVTNEKAEKQMNISEICGDCTSIIVDGRGLTKHKRFDFSDLVEVMKKLKAPNGCEWDRVQTHESIRINLIEEAYELVEAIDCASSSMMLEECGDVLMQAVFHTAIAEEDNEFNFSDMLTALCRKLIDRHTHIFGENHADNAEEALIFWNEAKKVEKKYLSTADAMNRIPKNLPSLLYAEKMQKLAKKCGFDWTQVDGAIDKVHEELQELVEADELHTMEEAGDLLFAVVNVLRFFKVEPEMALHEANMKFYRRFDAVEQKVTASGREMKDCTFEELDSFWNSVKQSEKTKYKTIV